MTLTEQTLNEVCAGDRFFIDGVCGKVEKTPAGLICFSQPIEKVFKDHGESIDWIRTKFS